MSAITKNVSRRSFMKWTGAVTGSSALVATAVSINGMPGVGSANAAHGEGMPDADQIVWSACTVNCGSRCPVRLQVKDGRLARVLPDNAGTQEIGTQQIRACVRGRAIRQRHGHPDRLKYPMKRVGKRGEGKFERISWEEAFDIIARKHKEIVNDPKNGNEAIKVVYATGNIGCVITQSWAPNGDIISRFLSCYGGSLGEYGDYSAAAIEMAAPATFGGWIASNSFDDAKNANIQIFWGNNTLETRMSGGGETFVAQQAKKIGKQKVIVIDPRYSETAVSLADEWIPIRPGTDAALCAGLAYVLITEKLADRDFLDKYCLGFDDSHLPAGAPANSSYESYVLGKGEDKTPKTPKWAADITGVPENRIISLARELANAAPKVHITQGWGLQRQGNGENQCRAIFTLCCMLGTVGVSGGGNGMREGSAGLAVAPVWNKENPVKKQISFFDWLEAVEHGHEMSVKGHGVKVIGAANPYAPEVLNTKLNSDVKILWQFAGNVIGNQHGDLNRTHAILQDESKAELIIVCENQMTVSARYADILLPDANTSEIDDIVTEGSSGPMAYIIRARKAVEPPFECMPIYDILRNIGRRIDELHAEDGDTKHVSVEKAFTEGRTQLEWAQYIWEETRKLNPKMPTFEEASEIGVYRVNAGSVIAMEDFRKDPEANPLKTPSGKIEIFSQAMWQAHQHDTYENVTDDVRTDPIPIYRNVLESGQAAKDSKYPLQLIGHHYKARTHSSYGNCDWLKEAHIQSVWINPIDASSRGVTDGEKVEIFNDRGRVHLVAKVTERIAPGVISIPQGAWFNPDANGVDQGGSVNTLTAIRHTAYARGNTQHTALAEVKKIS